MGWLVGVGWSVLILLSFSYPAYAESLQGGGEYQTPLRYLVIGYFSKADEYSWDLSIGING